METTVFSLAMSNIVFKGYPNRLVCLRLLAVFSVIGCLFFATLSAQNIHGTVKDQDGNPMPFVMVYKQKSTIGTTTNYEGQYSLKLDPGKHIVEYRFIGYETVVDTIVLSDHQSYKRNVKLQQKTVVLQEVEIKETEDPAVGMMKKAIALKEKNSFQGDSGQYEAFTKAIIRYSDITFPKKIFGVDLGFADEKAIDSLKNELKENDGIVYMMESQSVFSWQKPNHTKEEIFASRQSGDTSRYSALFSQLSNINFYDNHVQIAASSKKFASPLSDNAFLYYRFFLIDSVQDPSNGKIYQIKIVPKNTSANVFFGYLYLVDSLWNIKDIDVRIAHTNKIPWIDSINIRQSYIRLDDNVWIMGQTNTEHYLKISIFGINMFLRGTMIVYRQNFNLKPLFPKNFFSNEILRIDKDANKKDSVFGKQSPIVETSFERKHYRDADSIFRRYNHPDTIRKKDKMNNRFQFSDLLYGYTYKNRISQMQYHISSPLSAISFNTVQGWTPTMSFDFQKQYPSRRHWSTVSKLQYGFSDKTLRFQTSGSWTHSPDDLGYLYWSSGWNNATQYQEGAISDISNFFQSLFFMHNRKKIYGKTWLSVGHSMEICNGVIFSADLSYEHRKALVNHSDFRIIKSWKREYTSNDPRRPFGNDYPAFEEHDAFIANMSIQWTPFQKYAMLPHKERILSPYPVVSLSYRKALPRVFAAKEDFDFLESKISYTIPMGILGSVATIVKGGLFLKKPQQFIDYKHYKGNRSVLFSGSVDKFRALPLYDFSTTNAFMELHFRLNSNRWLFSKLPLVKQTKWVDEWELHALVNHQGHPYIEGTVGVSNIKNILGLCFSMGMQYEMAPVYRVTLSIQNRM